MRSTAVGLSLQARVEQTAGSAGGSASDRVLLGQGLLHCRDDAAEVGPIWIWLHGIGRQVPPVVTERAVHKLAVGAAALIERADVANILGLVEQAPGVFCVQVPVTPHLHDHFPRFFGQGLSTEPARAQRPVEVADDVGVVQLAEELADGQTVPHAAPVGVPGLVVAADGDPALAGREVLQVDADRVEAFDACDQQLGDCRCLDVHGFLQACSALRGRMRMVAIWGQVRYEVLSEV